MRNTGKLLDYLVGDPPMHTNMLKVLRLALASCLPSFDLKPCPKILHISWELTYSQDIYIVSSLPLNILPKTEFCNTQVLKALLPAPSFF